VLGGIMANITLENNRRLSDRLARVVDPSLNAMDDFKKMILESKMYTTNWVFLRYKQEDKDLLRELHNSGYAGLKTRLSLYSQQWASKAAIDSMHKVFNDFEELLALEKQIMQSLQKFTDYDDPVLKLEAERKVEDEVLPRTAALINSVNAVYKRGADLRMTENDKIEKSTSRLRTYIIALGIAMICIGFFLSFYLTKVIITPVKKINKMINDLGKGILRKVDHKGQNDEIASMVRSVNYLSDGLQSTANFANEVGLRNFDMPFQPLSEEDTLGKALIMMRQNLKTSEANLAMQNKELETKNRELEQFAYVASHDLQEPLQTTISFVNLFQQHYKDKLDERSGKYLSYITQASSRMKVLIADLLEYSRIGSKKDLQFSDCNVILNEVLENIAETIKATGADIKAEPLPIIPCYPNEMKQLFQHLIYNAIKFRKKNTPPYLRITARLNRDDWQFCFADNGIGISRENNERIFVIFQRLHTRSEYKGSGIGLSHCKKIVELHKGKIWLESEPATGTTFYFTIPQNNNLWNTN
jgi:signal transduction histidine kinase